MKISLTPASVQYASLVFEILRIFLPNLSWHELTGEVGETDEFLEISVDETQIAVGIVGGPIVNQRVKGLDNNEIKRAIKLSVYRLFTENLGYNPSPWGILIGIRPTKIVHRYWDKGLTGSQIAEELKEKYALDQGKISKLIEITKLQRKYLLTPTQAQKTVSIYISIPFCPTRCSYCSFPAFKAGPGSQIISKYLEDLLREIKGVGEAIKEKGINVETIYVGGGTPTTLDLAQLTLLLEGIKENLFQDNTREFTFEAGRPDTIDEDKFLLLKEFAVDRVSINPQTMWADTLIRISRLHTPEDIIAKFELARKTGFAINMDLIIGLPGEGLEEIRYSLDKIEMLKPENLTIHALAIKRTAKLKEEKTVSFLANPVSQMFNYAETWCIRKNYKPYYLYRQKQIVGNQENIGYYLEDKPCLYNIQMMEERQTIWGLGVGAGSKVVNPDDWTLENTYNPKDLLLYSQRIEEIIKTKVDKIKSLG